MPERLSSQSILPKSLLNWEETLRTTWVYFKKKKFRLSFFLIWEKLRRLVGASFKNSKTSFKLGKIWKFSLRLTLKNTSHESTD